MRSFEIPPIDYHAMRMLRFRIALVDFFRRWGLYLAVAIVVFGAGSNAPLSVTAAAASTLLSPLRAAADRGWLIVPATLVYAVIGALPVVLTRPLWWPRHWADAERALPLAARTIVRSDRLFGGIVMLPWQALLLSGWIAIAVNQDTGHDAVHRWLAVAAWVAAAGGSLILSLRWMHHVRSRAAGPIATSFMRPRPIAVRARTTRPLRVHRALLMLPLARGRANVSAGLLTTGCVMTITCAMLATWTPVPTGWALASLALAALVATSLLRSRTTRELRPLWHDQRQLPLDVRACDRAQRGLVLVPALSGICAGLVASAWSTGSVRPTVLTLYVVVLAVGCVLESIDTEDMKATNHAARWILMLALAIAFGSEVTP